MTVQQQDIAFESQGVTCRGLFFKADRKDKAPCVVLGHGFCGTIEMRLKAYAEAFAQAGYHAMAFDYRHFGRSDGTPRQILDIKKQHQDWRAAIAHARSLPGVDPGRIILWGTSFSGGHVAVMASEDKNIAAIISQAPHMSGPFTAMAQGLAQNIRLGIVSFIDRVGAVLGRTPFYVPALGRPGDLAAMTGPGEFEASRKLMPEGSQVDERVAARIFLALSLYSPGRLASKVTTPWLVQVALHDTTTPSGPTIQAAKRAAKGELVTYPVGHFEVYVPPTFEQVIADQIAFLRRHVSLSVS
jgi:pimeloyl-ACP methyl ester carboxylesterase